MSRTKRIPGEFHAECRLRRRVRVDRMTPEQRREVEEQKHERTVDRLANGKVRPVVLFPACEGFEAEDRTLFEAHMLDAHGLKATKSKSLRTARCRGPKLTEDGKPFEPAGLEPGATVTWRELVPTGETYRDDEFLASGQERPIREWVERSGQVWSLAPEPRSAWVVPFEPLEGELCVILREDRYDGSLRHSATQYTGKHRNAA